MNTFKISFLKLLRSTAMTFLFLPGVSAMAPEEDGWENYSHLMTPPTSDDNGALTSSSPTLLDENTVVLDSDGWQIWDPSMVRSSSSAASTALGFVQIEEEKEATLQRSLIGNVEPPKLFLFGGRCFIKGEVPGDGTCFLHTLNMLFPGREISRDRFAVLLWSAFSQEPGSLLPKEELHREFAAELYTQLHQRLVTQGGALEFNGEEINKTSEDWLSKGFDYFSESETVKATIESIAHNDKIIEEMLVGYGQTHTMLSLPNPMLKDIGIKTIGSFGLACKLFALNLDVYSPISDDSNSLYKREEEFRFGDASLPQAAFYAHHHVSPLCFEEDIKARKRFAENEIKVIKQMYETRP